MSKRRSIERNQKRAEERDRIELTTTQRLAVEKITERRIKHEENRQAIAGAQQGFLAEDASIERDLRAIKKEIETGLRLPAGCLDAGTWTVQGGFAQRQPTPAKQETPAQQPESRPEPDKVDTGPLDPPKDEPSEQPTEVAEANAA